MEFMEKDIRAKLTELNTLVLLQDDNFRDVHQVHKYVVRTSFVY